MFQLTPAEADELRDMVSPSVPTAPAGRPNSSQAVMSSWKHRGRAYRPYAFTEEVLMNTLSLTIFYVGLARLAVLNK